MFGVLRCFVLSLVSYFPPHYLPRVAVGFSQEAAGRALGRYVFTLNISQVLMSRAHEANEMTLQPLQWKWAAARAACLVSRTLPLPGEQNREK